MSFVVSIRETFRGAPDAKTEQVNMSGTFLFNSIGDVIEYIENDMKSIYSTRHVLKKTWIVRDDSLTCKLLFERRGKHGRLLRRYDISKPRRQCFDDWDEFSLI